MKEIVLRKWIRDKKRVKVNRNVEMILFMRYFLQSAGITINRR